MVVKLQNLWQGVKRMVAKLGAWLFGVMKGINVRDFAEELVDILLTMHFDEIKAKVVGKFLKLGVMLGRVYALVVVDGTDKPEGHPKAVHVTSFALLVDGALHPFTVWLVSFPKSRWEQLTDDQKLKFPLWVTRPFH